MQNTTERRQLILEMMCERRHDCVDNLAIEFDVSNRTIRRDIEILSISYPICMKQGTGGGVHVSDGYYIGREYLKPSQAELLGKLALTLEGVDKQTMQSILDAFVLKKQ